MSAARAEHTAEPVQADWLAVDWGTSCLRVWAMSAAGTVLAASASEQGMSSLRPDQYETVLLAAASDWLAADRVTPVIICGMAGSRQGWQEAAYLSLPVTLPGDFVSTPVKTLDARLAVHILPGLKQREPADVMRGEETQIVGFLSENPDFNGVLVLPGTHAKWARIQQQTVTQFTTCMTGELFKLLSEHSLLRHSVDSTEWSQIDFEQALCFALAHPNGFARRLFGLRANGLLHGQTASAARARLSAEMLALEITAITEALPDAKNLPLAVIGNDKLAALYCQALQLAGYNAQPCSGESITLTGLYAAYQTLVPTPATLTEGAC